MSECKRTCPVGRGVGCPAKFRAAVLARIRHLRPNRYFRFHFIRHRASGTYYWLPEGFMR